MDRSILQSLTLLLSLAISARAADPENWIGKTVVAARPGKLKIRAGNDVVAETTMSAFKVVNQKADWIEVVGFPQGWMQRSDFVSLDKAVAHFGRMLVAEPANAAHWFNLRGVANYNLDRLDAAMSDFDEAIRRNAQASIYFSNRGLVRARQKNFDQAIIDFDQAVRLEPKNALAFVNRGNAYRDKNDAEAAKGNYDAAIVLDPLLVAAYYNRAMTFEKSGDYVRAIADYGQAARLDSKDADAWNGIAWLLATCPDEKLRDGKKAIECGKFACDLTQEKESNYLDTLAAAYAESGDFDQATQWAKKALALATGDDKKEIENRLSLYGSKKPFRLPTKN